MFSWRKESDEDSLSMKSTYCQQPIRGYNKDNKEWVLTTKP